MFRKLITGAVIGGTGIAVWAGVAAIDNTKRDTSGTIQTSGDLGVFATHLGDCMNELPLPAQGGKTIEVSKGIGVPCTEPHHLQVYFKGTVSLTSFDVKGENDEALKICGNELNKLAATLSQAKLQEFQSATVFDLVPSLASWDHGDRALDCLLGNSTEFYSSSVIG